MEKWLSAIGPDNSNHLKALTVAMLRPDQAAVHSWARQCGIPLRDDAVTVVKKRSRWDWQNW